MTYIRLRLIMIDIGDPKPKLKWWSNSKRLMEMIEGVSSAKFSTYQLLSKNQQLITKTTSILDIVSLQREDHHSEVKCIAMNTNLTKPLEKSFRINLMRKLVAFVSTFY